jgi:hypothetical protein
MDRMAQPVIDIRFPERPQDDALAPRRGQRRRRQPVQHDPTLRLESIRHPGGELIYIEY